MELGASAQLELQWVWGDTPVRLWSRTDADAGEWTPVSNTGTGSDPGSALVSAGDSVFSSFFRLAP